MKSTVNVSEVYERMFSEDYEVIPIEYKTVQKYQSNETCKRFIPVRSKSKYFGGDFINSPFLSERSINLLRRYQ